MESGLIKGMPDKSENRSIISEATPIRVGLVIVVLAAGLSAFGSSIWFASNINSKLDFLVTQVSAVNSTIAELKSADMAINKEINDIRLSLALQKAQVETIQGKINTIK